MPSGVQLGLVEERMLGMENEIKGVISITSGARAQAAKKK